MNSKGFTLVELLAVIIVLALVAGFSMVGVNAGLGSAKEKSEDIFVNTLRDAIEIYLETDGKNQEFETSSVCQINKALGTANVYESKSFVKFEDIINSTYQPISKNDMINPGNKDIDCDIEAEIRIFRDDDYVYYYSFNEVGLKSLDCLVKYESEVINNLPAGCGV